MKIRQAILRQWKMVISLLLAAVLVITGLPVPPISAVDFSGQTSVQAEDIAEAEDTLPYEITDIEGTELSANAAGWFVSKPYLRPKQDSGYDAVGICTGEDPTDLENNWKWYTEAPYYEIPEGGAQSISIRLGKKDPASSEITEPTTVYTEQISVDTIKPSEAAVIMTGSAEAKVYDNVRYYQDSLTVDVSTSENDVSGYEYVFCTEGTPFVAEQAAWNEVGGFDPATKKAQIQVKGDVRGVLYLRAKDAAGNYSEATVFESGATLCVVASNPQLQKPESGWFTNMTASESIHETKDAFYIQDTKVDIQLQMNSFAEAEVSYAVLEQPPAQTNDISSWTLVSADQISSDTDKNQIVKLSFATDADNNEKKIGYIYAKITDRSGKESVISVLGEKKQLILDKENPKGKITLTKLEAPAKSDQHVLYYQKDVDIQVVYTPEQNEISPVTKYEYAMVKESQEPIAPNKLLWNDCSSAGATANITATIQQGRGYVAFRVTDAAGNYLVSYLTSDDGSGTNTKNIVVVDTEEPLVTVTAKKQDPDNPNGWTEYNAGDWTNQNVRFSVSEKAAPNNANRNQDGTVIAGIDHYEYAFAESENNVPVENLTWTPMDGGQLTISSDTNGTYYFRAVSNTKIAGEADSVEVKIQKEFVAASVKTKTAGTAEFAEMEPGSTMPWFNEVNRPEIQIAFPNRTAKNPAPVTVSYSWEVDGASEAPSVINVTETDVQEEQTIPVPDFEDDGTYILTVTTSDAAGNINDPVEYTFQYDKTKPAVTFNADTEPAETSKDKILYYNTNKNEGQYLTITVERDGEDTGSPINENSYEYAIIDEKADDVEASLGQASWKSCSKLSEQTAETLCKIILNQIRGIVAFRVKDDAQNETIAYFENQKCIVVDTEKPNVQVQASIPAIDDPAKQETYNSSSWTNQTVTLQVSELGSADHTNRNPENGTVLAGIDRFEYAFVEAGSSVSNQDLQWNKLDPQNAKLTIDHDTNGIYRFHAVSNTGITGKDVTFEVKVQKDVMDSASVTAYGEEIKGDKQQTFEWKQDAPDVQIAFPAHKTLGEYQAPITVTYTWERADQIDGTFAEIAVNVAETKEYGWAEETKITNPPVTTDAEGYAVDGVYRLTVCTTDAAGNTADGLEYIFKYDQSEPAIELTYDFNDGESEPEGWTKKLSFDNLERFYYNYPVKVKATIDANISGVKEYQFYDHTYNPSGNAEENKVKFTLPADYKESTDNNEITIQFTIPSNHQHMLSLEAKDNAENTATAYGKVREGGTKEIDQQEVVVDNTAGKTVVTAKTEDGEVYSSDDSVANHGWTNQNVVLTLSEPEDEKLLSGVDYYEYAFISAKEAASADGRKTEADLEEEDWTILTATTKAVEHAAVNGRETTGTDAAEANSHGALIEGTYYVADLLTLDQDTNGTYYFRSVSNTGTTGEIASVVVKIQKSIMDSASVTAYGEEIEEPEKTFDWSTEAPDVEIAFPDYKQGLDEYQAPITVSYTWEIDEEANGDYKDVSEEKSFTKAYGTEAETHITNPVTTNAEDKPVDGVYRLTVRTRDAAGNSAQNLKYIFKYDQSEPAIEMTYDFSDGASVTDGWAKKLKFDDLERFYYDYPVQVKATIDGSISGVKEYYFEDHTGNEAVEFDPADYQATTDCESGDNEITIQFTIPLNHQHMLSLTATDIAGNEATAYGKVREGGTKDQQEVVVDNTAGKTVVSAKTEDGEVYSSDDSAANHGWTNQNVVLTLSEPEDEKLLSGVDYYEYTFVSTQDAVNGLDVPAYLAEDTNWKLVTESSKTVEHAAVNGKEMIGEGTAEQNSHAYVDETGKYWVADQLTIDVDTNATYYFRSVSNTGVKGEIAEFVVLIQKSVLDVKFQLNATDPDADTGWYNIKSDYPELSVTESHKPYEAPIYLHYTWETDSDNLNGYEKEKEIGTESTQDGTSKPLNRAYQTPNNEVVDDPFVLPEITEDGIYQLNIWYTDVFGNVIEPIDEDGNLLAKDQVYKCDKTVPTEPTISYSDNWFKHLEQTNSYYYFYVDKMTVTANALDEFSGIAQFEFYDEVSKASFETIHPVASRGEQTVTSKEIKPSVAHQMRVTVTDIAGNSSVASEDSFVVDDVAGKTDIDMKTADGKSYSSATTAANYGWTNQDVVLTLSEPEDGPELLSGVDYYEYTFVSKQDADNGLDVAAFLAADTNWKLITESSKSVEHAAINGKETIGTGTAEQNSHAYVDGNGKYWVADQLTVEGDTNGTFYFRSVSNTGVKGEIAESVVLIQDSPLDVEFQLTAPATAKTGWYNSSSTYPVELSVTENHNPYEAPIFLHYTWETDEDNKNGYDSITGTEGDGNEPLKRESLTPLQSVDSEDLNLPKIETDGVYRLNIWYTDAFGNVIEPIDEDGNLLAKDQVYKCDKTIPKDVTISYSDNWFKLLEQTNSYEYFYPTPVKVTASANGEISGISSFEFYDMLADATFQTFTQSSDSTRDLQTVVSKEIGAIIARQMKVIVTDVAGNSAEAAERKFAVDNAEGETQITARTADGVTYDSSADAANRGWTEQDVVITLAEPEGVILFSGVDYYEYAYISAAEAASDEGRKSAADLKEEDWKIMPQTTGKVQHVAVDGKETVTAEEAAQNSHGILSGGKYCVADQLTIGEDTNGTYYFRSVSNTGIKGKISEYVVLIQKSDLNLNMSVSEDRDRDADTMWYNAKTGFPVLSVSESHDPYEAPIFLHYRWEIDADNDGTCETEIGTETEDGEAILRSYQTPLETKPDEEFETPVISRDGVYRLSIWYTDVFGHVVQVSETPEAETMLTNRIYRCDITAPTDVTISYSDNWFKQLEKSDSYYNFYPENMTLTATANAEISGIAQYEFYDELNGVSLETIIPDSASSRNNQTVTSRRIDATVARQMKVIVTDIAGNSTEASEKPFVVDNVAGKTVITSKTANGEAYSSADAAANHGWTKQDVVITLAEPENEKLLSGVDYYEYAFISAEDADRGTDVESYLSDNGNWTILTETDKAVSHTAVDGTERLSPNGALQNSHSISADAKHWVADQLTIREDTNGTFYFRSVSNTGIRGIRSEQVVMIQKSNYDYALSIRERSANDERMVNGWYNQASGRPSTWVEESHNPYEAPLQFHYIWKTDSNYDTVYEAEWTSDANEAGTSHALSDAAPLHDIAQGSLAVPQITADGVYELTIWLTDVFGAEVPNSRKTGQFYVDTTPASISVEYINSNQMPYNVASGYYNQDRIALLTVADMTFDSQAVVMEESRDNTPYAARESGWNRVTADYFHTYQENITFSEDGDYSFTFSLTDYAGNQASYSSVDLFTIDQTAPVITVEFDDREKGNTPENGIYYRNKQGRVATVTIVEHNYGSAADVVVQGQATRDAKSFPAIRDMGSNGDVRTLQIPFADDGNYAFTVNYTDLAGNAAVQYSVPEFVIDHTEPTLVIRGMENGSSSNEEQISFSVTSVDTNADVFQTKLTRWFKDTENVIQVDEENDVRISDDGTVIYYDNLPIDGVYSLDCTIRDKAGNEWIEAVYLNQNGEAVGSPRTRTEIETAGAAPLYEVSVNREGSTFRVRFEPDEEIRQKVIDTEAEDLSVIIEEWNVTSIEPDAEDTERERPEIHVSNGDNNQIFDAEKNVNFISEVNTKWQKYTYTLNGSQYFAADGDYNIYITNTDKTGNLNNSSSYKENDEQVALVNFSIDRTSPSISVQNEITDHSSIEADQIDVRIHINDRHFEGNDGDLVVEVNDVVQNNVQRIDNSEYKFTLESGQYDSIQITAKDQLDIGENDPGVLTISDVTVSTNWFVLMFSRIRRNLLMFSLISVLVLAAVAGLIFFIILKRKKNEDEESEMK